MNTRINMYIPHKLREQIDLTARKSGTTKSSIVEAALMGHFSAEHGDLRDAVLIKRLDQMNRKMDVQVRNFMVMSESLALFIRYYLTVMPRLKEEEKLAARDLGNERFAVFIEQIRKNLLHQSDFIHDVIEDIPRNGPDFYGFGPVTEEDMTPDLKKDISNKKEGASDE